MKLISISQIQGLQEIISQIQDKIENFNNHNSDSTSPTTIQKIKFSETLFAKNWSEQKYTITNENIKADSDIFMTVHEGTSPQVYKMFSEACIACYEQSDNTLVLIANGVVPEQDVIVNFLII